MCIGIFLHTSSKASHAILLGAMSTKSIKDKTFLARDIVQINQLSLPPNQSLKLTEPAVDDFARAKQPVTIGHDYLARTGFRRCGTSLPQLSSGPLGCARKDNNDIFCSTMVTGLVFDRYLDIHDCFCQLFPDFWILALSKPQEIGQS